MATDVRPSGSGSSRRGLVLGCGGSVGFAWSVAVLSRLEESWGWDAREADLIVGTSAGSELAALLGGGVSVAEVLAALRGDDSAPDWLRAHLSSRPGRFPGVPALRPSSLRLVAQRRVSAVTALSGLAPAGRSQPAFLDALTGHLAAGDGWVPHPATWIVAADRDTGDRVAFGAPLAPPASLRLAVRASWAVPGFYAPVPIGDRHYIDGGVVSPASADLALQADVDDVVVIAPMASTGPAPVTDFASRAERLLRRRMSARLAEEIGRLDRAGVHVIVRTPGADALAAMGANFMDARRMPAALEAGLG